MAKFQGKIGFVNSQETAPGVHSEVITERNYKGDILRNSQSWERGEYLNDNIDISNRLSIVADQFAYDNLSYMRYIFWMNAKWKIKSIDIQRPRLILTVGGVYNG